MTTSIVIRGFLTGALLLLVWFNSHWSVALCITLIYIGDEIMVINIDKLIKNKAEKK